MSIDQIKWQRTCCAFHGEYAEHGLKVGGVARIKRAADGAITVMRFNSANQCLDKGADGAPVYVPVAAAELSAMLA